MTSTTSNRRKEPNTENENWIEKRGNQRLLSVLKAGFRRVGEKEVAKLKTERDSMHFLNGIHNLTSVQTTDLSSGGLSLLGKEPFKNGEWLLVEVDLPKAGGGFRCLAEVRWVDSYQTSEGTTYRTGLKFTFIRPYDLDRVNSYLKFWGRA
jgi:hypothetical protein